MHRISENLRILIDSDERIKGNVNQLARETGVPQPTITRILSGESKDPRWSTVAPIAEYFGVTIEVLMDGQKSVREDIANYNDDPQRTHLLNLCRKLPVQELKNAVYLITLILNGQSQQQGEKYVKPNHDEM